MLTLNPTALKQDKILVLVVVSFHNPLFDSVRQLSNVCPNAVNRSDDIGPRGSGLAKSNGPSCGTSPLPANPASCSSVEVAAAADATTAAACAGDRDTLLGSPDALFGLGNGSNHNAAGTLLIKTSGLYQTSNIDGPRPV